MKALAVRIWQFVVQAVQCIAQRFAQSVGFYPRIIKVQIKEFLSLFTRHTAEVYAPNVKQGSL